MSANTCEQSKLDGPYGNVFIRPLPLGEVGEKVIGHLHSYDHATLVSTGSVFLRAYEVDPITERRTGTPSVDKVLSAPAIELIKKNWMHEFTKLENGTTGYCIFALRDEQGQVTDVWDEQWGMAASI